MDLRECEFYVIRYVPSTPRGEFTNIGVIFRPLDGSGEDPVVRITKDWTRVLCVDPGAHIEMLAALEETFRVAATEMKDNANALITFAEETFSLSVQLSRPKGTLAFSLEAGADRAMQTYVDSVKYSDDQNDPIEADTVPETDKQAGDFPLDRK